MVNTIKIGAVSYLNTKPLVFGLAESLPVAEIVYDYPSRLSAALAHEELDIALVPSAELLSHRDWTVVSDACIACRGPVLSVKLLFRVRPSEVKTLALDAGSRTSAMLSQVLLWELHAVRPLLTELPLGVEPAESTADAVLVIGDRAIRSEHSEYCDVWDLGDRWCRAAELPFVFATWVARPGVETTEVVFALESARNRGCAQLHQIAREQSVQMQLPEALVVEYLTKNLHFTFGEREQRGLELFFAKSVAGGFATDLRLPLSVSCQS